MFKCFERLGQPKNLCYLNNFYDIHIYDIQIAQCKSTDPNFIFEVDCVSNCFNDICVKMIYINTVLTINKIKFHRIFDKKNNNCKFCDHFEFE